MIEQERIDTPNDSAPTSTSEEKPTKKSKSSKKAVGETAKRLTQRNASLTDDQKRLARNAALREWRRKNADRMKAYMTEWRAKRKVSQPKGEPQTAQTAPAAVLGIAKLKRKGPAPVAKTSTSKKPKKAGKR